MAKKELTKLEQNEKIWSEIRKLEQKIVDLKETLHPAELQKQATLAECNALAAKAKVQSVRVDPAKLADEAPKAR